MQKELYQKKVKHAQWVIKKAIQEYKKVGVACSFGKDSLTTTHLARSVDPNIPVFSVMTIFKPRATFEYLKYINNKLDLHTTIYIVADHEPKLLQDDNLTIKLLPTREFNQAVKEVKKLSGKKIYSVDPSECCRLLKVEPIKVAVKDLDAWVSGLRNTEGITRENLKEIEEKDGLIKINPILSFTEKEVWRYLKENNIPMHPWYSKKLSDGKRYRSLGCQPCTRAIFDQQSERDGRWQSTSKCGGECGIHTQTLKN